MIENEAAYFRKIAYLKNTKSQIKDNIIEKGVEVTEDNTFREYAGKILQIPTEGGGNYVIGYYYNNAFYFDASHTQLIEPSRKNLYLDIPSNKLYSYNAELQKYIRISCNSDRLFIGYYFEGEFYEDASHTIPALKSPEAIYIDLPSGTFYGYKPGIGYVKISGLSYTKEEANALFAFKEHGHVLDDIDIDYMTKAEMLEILNQN